MNMQNSAAEQELRCVLAGTLMKVAPLLSQRGGVCLLSANFVWVWRKTEEVCEVNLRGEWPYLAASASGWE